MDTLAADREPPAPWSPDTEAAIQQLSDQALFLIGRDGRITSWNAGVGRLLGWTRDDWIGQRFDVVFTPEDIAAGVAEAELRQAAAEGRADDTRWLRRRDGERFYALGTLTRIVDHRGQIAGFVKTLRDHGRTHQLEEEVRRLRDAIPQLPRAGVEHTAATLGATIEAVGDGVLIAGEQGVQRCNAAAVRILGAGSEHELLHDGSELIRRFRLRRERDGPAIGVDDLPMLQQAGSAETLPALLWATRIGDGIDVCLRWSSTPIVVASHPIGCAIVVSDVSERLQWDRERSDLDRAQDALQIRDAELRALVDGVRDYAIFTIDTGGRIASWHTGAERMKGYTAEQAIGMPFERLFIPEDRAAGRPADEMQRAARDGEFKGEGPRLRADGTVFDAAVVLTALRGNDGRLLGFLKLTQDISERRAADRQRAQALRDAHAARAEAERASHAKGEFLAMISHELRTPLSAILGWAHVLERGVLDPVTVGHGLAAIARNARLQVHLIDQLLDMNRIESGRLQLETERVELGGVIAAAIDAVLPAAADKGIALRTAFTAGSGVVLGDSVRLQQVVSKLLDNAIRFTPTGGRVDVGLWEGDDHVDLVVADTGQGIEPGFAAHLFERFRQQDPTTTRRHGGLGVGLAMVRGIVALHGGSVHAQSAGRGQGSTFTVTLPLWRASAAPRANTASAPRQPAPEPDRIDGISVLLVDDEPDLREVTAQLLLEAGAEVHLAADAEQALTLLRDRHPDVVVSDIAMPGTDGYELMRRIRQLPAPQGGDTPAAAFSAYARDEDRERARAAGYQLHLVKPVAPVDLVSAIGRLARSRRPPPADDR